MKIVVLGSTGTTGTLVVDEALAAGHQVVAFARRPEAVTPRPGLEVASGSADDVAAMVAAFAGADCVISVLGVPVTPRVMFCGTDFQQRTLPRILAALEQAQVKRFVLMSSFGSGDTVAKASRPARLMAYQTVGKRLFDDKALAERALDTSSVNWTTVYPVVLKKGPAIPHADVVPLDQVAMVPGVQVLPFANVAIEMVKLAPNEGLARQKLLITTPGGWRSL